MIKLVDKWAILELTTNLSFTMPGQPFLKHISAGNVTYCHNLRLEPKQNFWTCTCLFEPVSISSQFVATIHDCLDLWSPVLCVDAHSFEVPVIPGDDDNLIMYMAVVQLIILFLLSMFLIVDTAVKIANPDEPFNEDYELVGNFNDYNNDIEEIEQSDSTVVNENK
jgi:hypothetical protein